MVKVLTRFDSLAVMILSGVSLVALGCSSDDGEPSGAGDDAEVENVDADAQETETETGDTEDSDGVDPDGGTSLEDLLNGGDGMTGEPLQVVIPWEMRRLDGELVTCDDLGGNMMWNSISWDHHRNGSSCNNDSDGLFSRDLPSAGPRSFTLSLKQMDDFSFFEYVGEFEVPVGQSEDLELDPVQLVLQDVPATWSINGGTATCADVGGASVVVWLGRGNTSTGRFIDCSDSDSGELTRVINGEYTLGASLYDADSNELAEWTTEEAFVVLPSEQATFPTFEFVVP